MFLFVQICARMAKNGQCTKDAIAWRGHAIVKDRAFAKADSDFVAHGYSKPGVPFSGFKLARRGWLAGGFWRFCWVSGGKGAVNRCEGDLGGLRRFPGMGVLGANGGCQK
jgi:hypothetical protein